MIVRRCAQGHDVVIHKNTKPNMEKIIKMVDGSYITIQYPNSKDYFLMVDGEIVQKSDSFKTIEKAYVAECAKRHSDGHGRIDYMIHKIINNQVVDR
jgi:hypothetical protein